MAVDEFNVGEPKTKTLLQQLKTLELSSVLIVTQEVEQNLYLAARNVKGVDVRDVHGIDPVSLISHDKVLITVGALKQLEEALA